MSVTIAMVPRSAKTTRKPVLVALLLVLCAAFGLTACQTKVGAAAVVGGEKITPEQVDGYVDVGAKVDGQAIRALDVRRQFALQIVIVQKLQLAWLADKSNGGAVTADESTFADQAIQQNFQTNDIAGISSLAEANGYTPTLTQPIVQYVRNGAIIARRTNAASPNAIGSALMKTKIKVSVSPRYGTWSASDAAINGYVPPSFLLPTPAPTPEPQPQG